MGGGDTRGGLRQAGVVDDDLALLTGPRAANLIAAALATAGGSLVSWRVRQVTHRPGRSTTVAYAARVRWPDGETDETLGASTGALPHDAPDLPDLPGRLTLTDGERRVRVWRLPLDPALPGLARALDPRGVAGLLASLGEPGATGRGGTTRVRSYRPGRRAVVEVRAPGHHLFLKVMRPHRAPGLHERHRLLHEAGLPVPGSLGWSEDGIVALRALTGTPMRRHLVREGPLPTGEAVWDLLARLPAAVLTLPRRRAWTESAPRYARLIGSALPDEADRAAGLAAAILAEAAEVTTGPDEPCHGDLHEAQLLLDGGRIRGLLDLDSVGPGRRADDMACLIAHAEVLALIHPHRADPLAAVVEDWWRAGAARLDPAELRCRTAGVLLSLATGPHRVRESHWRAGTTARLDLVERWLTGHRLRGRAAAPVVARGGPSSNPFGRPTAGRP